MRHAFLQTSCRSVPTAAAQCSEFELLDWRRFRRPLPGANARAFELPQQPVALLMAQQAARAQRAAIASRIDRLQLMRLHQEREQQQAQQQRQQQQSPQQRQQQQGLPAGGDGALPALFNPFGGSGARQLEPHTFAQQQDDWQQQQQQLQGQLDRGPSAAQPHHQQPLKQDGPGDAGFAGFSSANGRHSNGRHAPAFPLQQSSAGPRAAG